jgi:hypothetical protein
MFAGSTAPQSCLPGSPSAVAQASLRAVGEGESGMQAAAVVMCRHATAAYLAAGRLRCWGNGRDSVLAGTRRPILAHISPGPGLLTSPTSAALRRVVCCTSRH